MSPPRPISALPYDVVVKIVEAMEPTPVERRPLEAPLSKSEAGNVFAHLPLAVVANPFAADFARAKDKENQGHGSLVAAFNARMKGKPADQRQAITAEWAGEGHLLPPKVVALMLQDFDFLRARIDTFPEALVEASFELQSEPALLLAVLRSKPEVLEQIHPNAMAFNYPFLQKATKVHGLVLGFGSPAMRRAPELCWAAVRNQPQAIVYVDPEVPFYPALALAAVTAEGKALAALPEPLRDSRDLVLAAVCQDGLALAFAGPRACNDPHLVEAATAQNRHALQFASNALRDNLAFLSPLVTRFPAAFRHAGQEARNDPALAALALAQWPAAICHAGPAIQGDRRNVVRAIGRAPSTLLGVEPRFFADKDLVLLALDHPDLVPRLASLILLRIDARLQADVDVVTAALMHDGLAIEYASVALRDNREAGYTAVCNNGAAFVHLSERLRSDHELAWVAIPATLDVYAQLGASLKGDAGLALRALRCHQGAVVPLLDPALLSNRTFVEQASTIFPAILRSATVSPWPA